MLAVQYYPPFNEKASGSIRQIWILGVFGLSQYLVATALLACRGRSRARWPGYVAVTLSLTRLLIAKLLPENARTCAT